MRQIPSPNWRGSLRCAALESWCRHNPASSVKDRLVEQKGRGHNIAEFCIRKVSREKSSAPLLYCCCNIVNIIQRKMDGRSTFHCLMESTPKATRHRAPRDGTGSPLPPVCGCCLLSKVFHVWIPAKSNGAHWTAVSSQHALLRGCLKSRP